MEIDGDFWRGRTVLVTGHTGFKGAWLALWLRALGADVTGVSAGAPGGPSMYELTRAGEGVREIAADVRDGGAVTRAVAEARPEIVMHLAAQPLLRRSLSDPAGTFATNVMGTVNVLDAVRTAGQGVRAVVVVSSDKCYETEGLAGGRLREGDPLGGVDPYSSSKACAELVVSSYRRSFFADTDCGLATARAGNVIGGGDWSADRLVPDAVRAVASGSLMRVRNPSAVRPWQHVLSPLAGYLLLAQRLFAGEPVDRPWNFGPRPEDEQTVGWVVQRLAELWDGELLWELDTGEQLAETAYLALDSSAAEGDLGWMPACSLARALALVVQWHRAHRAGEDMRAVSLAQIADPA